MLNLLRVEDLLKNGVYHTASAVIEKIIPPRTLQTEGGKLINLPALKFVGKEKLLLLNATNQRLIHFATGSELGPDSIGKTIRIEPRIVMAFKDEVIALRVMPGVILTKGLLDELGRSANIQRPNQETKKRADGTTRNSIDPATGPSLQKSGSVASTHKVKPNVNENKPDPPP